MKIVLMYLYLKLKRRTERLEKQLQKAKKPVEICSVAGCESNSLTSSSNIKFYSFAKLPRKKLIKLKKRTDEQSSLTKVCSKHFIGYTKSDRPLSSNYVVLPSESKKRKMILYKRRLSNKSTKIKPEKESIKTLDFPELILIKEYQHKETQVDFWNGASDLKTFICNRNTNGQICEAEVQINIPLLVKKENY